MRQSVVPLMLSIQDHVLQNAKRPNAGFLWSLEKIWSFFSLEKSGNYFLVC